MAVRGRSPGLRAPSRAKTVALWCCAAAAVALLAISYGVALARGDWPRGHPWHGIALAAMAGFFVVQTRLHRGGVATRVVALVLPLVAMAAMAIALSSAPA